MRFCNRCGETKDESQFYRRGGNRKGSFQAWCIPCRKAYHRTITGSYPTQTCSVCGKEFNNRKASAFTCSEECAYVRRRQINNEKRRLIPKTKDCAWCGAAFESSRQSQLYCSRRCLAATARLYRYGLTPESFRQMLADQERKCAICQSELEVGGIGWTNNRVVIDHCHTTGRVRGLLCTGCNVMLGQSKDEPGRLRAAADYLEAA